MVMRSYIQIYFVMEKIVQKTKLLMLEHLQFKWEEKMQKFKQEKLELRQYKKIIDQSMIFLGQILNK